MESSLIGFSRGDYSSKTFQAINPADSEKLPTHYAHASEDEVEQACLLATNAALILSSLSGKEKSVFLETLASGIDEIGDQIVEIMTKRPVCQNQGYEQKRVEPAGSCVCLQSWWQKGTGWMPALIGRNLRDNPCPSLICDQCSAQSDQSQYFVQVIFLWLFQLLEEILLLHLQQAVR